MVVVDNEGVDVSPGPVAMRMPMRLGSLPAFMIMLMVLVMDVQMLMVARTVLMGDLHGIRLGPQRQGKSAGDQDHGDHDGERRDEPEPRSDPSRCRICDEPTGMGERELRGKQRRPVFGMGRAPQQPS